MKLNIDAVKLENYLKTDSDCEEIAAGEFVADFYEVEKPVTLNLTLRNGEVICDAAAYLIYDGEQDGWYMGEQINDAAELENVLKAAIEA